MTQEGIANTPGVAMLEKAWLSQIRIAVLAERERCAKIAESGICDGLSREDKALAKAAEDIRKGESRYGIR